MAEIEEQVVYCIHSECKDCVKCEKLQKDLDELVLATERLKFRLMVKFNAEPPKGIDFTFE